MDERDRDLDRLLTFVDAIVAIAITLLVLPLVELAGEIGEDSGSVGHLLGEHVDQLVAFVLSYLVIARIWLAQHRVVRGLLRANRPIVEVLILWTFTIVVLPFPTALAAQTERDPLVYTLYIGTMGISSVLISVLAALVAREPLAAGVPPPSTVSGLVTVGCFAVALALAILVPGVGYWGLLTLVLAEPIEARIRRSARARSSA